MRILKGFILFVLMVSCFPKKDASGDSDIFLASKKLAELTEKKLDEVSGVAASVKNPGLLWALNDSGNPAEVYLIDESLKLRLVCKLAGVKNRDWEDIAVGPGPDEKKKYVYVADIGDNNGRYPYKYIYRFEEPLQNTGGTITITEFDTLVFELEGEKKDTESLLVDPKTASIFVVSKREKPVHVYEIKFPFASQDTLIARSIISLPLTQIVAADFSADGEEILMKNYDNIYYWNLKGRPLPEALQDKPAILKYTEEPQGEAITFNLDGSGFYTLSERIKGEKTFLYYYERAAP